MPELPELTPLQFLVLGMLAEGERAGRELRRQLARYEIRRTAPAFYQMMARLEHAGWVDGWYDQKVVDSQIIKERRYRLTAAGAAEWTRTRQFYAKEGALRKLKKGWADA